MKVELTTKRFTISEWRWEIVTYFYKATHLEMDDEKTKLNEADLSLQRQVEPGPCRGLSILTLLAFAIIIAGLCFGFSSIIKTHHSSQVVDKDLERIFVDINETVAV